MQKTRIRCFCGEWSVYAKTIILTQLMLKWTLVMTSVLSVRGGHAPFWKLADSFCHSQIVITCHSWIVITPSLKILGQAPWELGIVKVRDDKVETGRGSVGNGRKPRPFVQVDTRLRNHAVVMTMLWQPKMCGRRRWCRLYLYIDPPFRFRVILHKNLSLDGTIYVRVRVRSSVYGYQGASTCRYGSQQDGMRFANTGSMMYLYGCIHVYLFYIHVALINVFPTCAIVCAECTIHVRVF